MRELNEEPYSYCSVYYNKDNFLTTYEGTVYPFPTVVTWNIPNEVKDVLVLPSKIRVRPGRQKKGVKLHEKAKLNISVANIASMDTTKKSAKICHIQHKKFEYFQYMFSIFSVYDTICHT